MSVRRTTRLPMEELAPYLLDLPDPPAPLNWTAIFGNRQPVEMEIGFGKGLFLLTAAQACPGVNFLGVEVRPIRFQKDGMSASVSIPGMLDQGVSGVPSALNPEEPLHLDNTLHPANSRLGLAKATHSHLHAFALNLDDDSGSNNGFFAPFKWQS